MTDDRGGYLRVAEAALSDVSSLREFILEAWKEAGPSAWGWTGATETSVQELASMDHLRELVLNPGVKVLLAMDGERVIGFAVNRKVDEIMAELAGIIVSEGSTGKGVGTALIKAAMKAASEQGFRDVTVKTEVFNERAIGFYEANGFRRAGLTTEVVEGRGIDLVILKRRLAPTVKRR